MDNHPCCSASSNPWDVAADHSVWPSPLQSTADPFTKAPTFSVMSTERKSQANPAATRAGTAGSTAASAAFACRAAH